MSKSKNTLRKFIESVDVSDWEIETPTGWQPISHTNKTIEYDVWEIKTDKGTCLRGADTHILIDIDGNEVFLKDSLGMSIKSTEGHETVISVEKLDTKVNMYDLTVDSEDHTYYTNGLLSHNTTVAAGYLLWYAMFVKDSHILVAAHKYDGALEIMDRIRFAYEGLPDHIRAGVREYNKKSLRFDNGSIIESQTTTANTGRGKSLSLIYLDEFAFVEPKIAREFWTSISPTLSTGGKAIITSTPNTDEDMFAHIWFEAQKNTDEYGNVIRNIGRNGFKPFCATWEAHPERDEKWADQERSKIGEERFEREHNCKFITFDETLINSVKLAKLEPSAPVDTVGHIRWYKKIDPNKTYCVGLDPSMGTGGDDAAIQVIELPTLEQVAEWQHNKTPVEGQVRVLKDICKYIHDAGAEDIYWSVESNSLGEAVLVVIRDTGEENFPGMFLHDQRKDLGMKHRRKGFITTHRTKLEACARVKSWIESGKLKIHSQNLISQLKTFVRSGNSYAAKVGEKDDLVMSLVLVSRMAQVISTFDDRTYSAVNSNIDDDNHDEPLPIFIV